MKTIRMKNIFKQVMKVFLVIVILLCMMLFLFEIIFFVSLWFSETYM